ncbi:MAG TPA: D-aminoacylase [Chloroflexi bacterium]|nr:D-aminoacylase [Chloroflexota bacterium]
MLDLLIKNGTVLDGTGKPPLRADVGVSQGHIALLAKDIEHESSRIIDASGLHVAPGFIDAHTHSELTLLANPMAESKIRQGVTTEVVGNCGDSPGPLLGAAMVEEQAGAQMLGVDIDWTSLGGYLDRLRSQGIAVNVVTLVGHNTVRGAVLGFDDVQPTPEQQAAMEQLVAEAMEHGARGLSTGLFYPPGYYAHTEEVIGLAKVAARYGGLYASHVRSETDHLIEAVEEAIEIGQQADIAVQISHIKAEGYRNWGAIDRLARVLEEASLRGVDLHCDQYPYDAGLSWLAYILPYWAQAGGSLEVAQRLRDPTVRSQLREDWEANRSQWEERGGMRSWDDLMITTCHARPEIQGRTVAAIAKDQGKDPFEAALDLIAMSEGQVECVGFGQLEENVRALMRHPLVVVGSDGESLAPYGILAQIGTHPRSYGTFPRVLGHYVRQEKVLSLEEAVRKMTSTTADRFGITDRGVIREGAWADLVLFDAQTVADNATYTDPHQYPTGIPYVIVNGVVVIDQGRHTKELPGQVL